MLALVAVARRYDSVGGSFGHCFKVRGLALCHDGRLALLRENCNNCEVARSIILVDIESVGWLLTPSTILLPDDPLLVCGGLAAHADGTLMCAVVNATELMLKGCNALSQPLNNYSSSTYTFDTRGLKGPQLISFNQDGTLRLLNNKEMFGLHTEITLKAPLATQIATMPCGGFAAACPSALHVVSQKGEIAVYPYPENDDSHASTPHTILSVATDCNGGVVVGANTEHHETGGLSHKLVLYVLRPQLTLERLQYHGYVAFDSKVAISSRGDIIAAGRAGIGRITKTGLAPGFIPGMCIKWLPTQKCHLALGRSEKSVVVHMLWICSKLQNDDTTLALPRELWFCIIQFWHAGLWSL